MATDDPIEIFLRNALSVKKVEDRAVRQALRELRQVLTGIKRSVEVSDLLTISPNREQLIRRFVEQVALSVQRTWGVTILQSLQEDLIPYYGQQLDFARRMIQSAGGTLPQVGAALSGPMTVAQAVQGTVVGGKTLGQVLTQQLPVLVADRVEGFIRLAAAEVGGDTLPVYQDAVVRVTERNVEATIRTAVHEVGSAAQQAVYEFETDPEWGKGMLVWTAVLDSRVCPVCVALDGKEFPNTYRKVSPHFNCVLPETKVQPGIIASAMRGTYSGNVVTIRTESGRVLSVTENHPLLTSQGWKPAKLINEGDQAICQRREVVDTIAIPTENPNLNQGPSTAEQLFTLLDVQATVKRCGVPVAPVDFHSDGAGMDGQIDIAAVNWPLLFNEDAALTQEIRCDSLVHADMALGTVAGLGTLDALLLALHATATGFVGSSDLAAALLGGHLSPFEGFRLALIARRDPSFDEPLANGATVDAKSLSDFVLAHAGTVEVNDGGKVRVGLAPNGDACNGEVAPDRFATHAKALSDLIQAHPGLVELDNVIGVEVAAVVGQHVYDFSTISGCYLAEGILTHNCRCYLIPAKWRNDTITEPDGSRSDVLRPVEGDKGDGELSFKASARKWVKDNPETAKDIFGTKLGQQLADGEISFDKAIKLWQAPKGAS